MPRLTSQVNDTEFPFAEDTTPFILVLNTTDAQGGDSALEGIADKDYERGYSTAWTADKKYEMVLRYAHLAPDHLAQHAESVTIWAHQPEGNTQEKPQSLVA